jgi:hypothetical protein
MIKFILTNIIVLFVATFYAQITINEASNANSTWLTTIQFIDLQGQLVQQFEIDAYYSKVGTKFDVSAFANGYYFVRILQDGLMDQKPFVKY